MKLSLLLAGIIALASGMLYAQDDPAVDPNACTLQEIGHMHGWIGPCRGGNGQQFGTSISAVGDVNEDSLMDWCVGYVRCDTLLTHSSGFQSPSLRLQLYHGTRLFPPSINAGEEIGPAELGADVKLLTSGDFDGDTHRDLVVSICRYNDSTEQAQAYEPKRLVIYWGDGSGHFSNGDTTQLENLHTLWYAIPSAYALHLPGENADRLIVRGGGTIVGGTYIYTPSVHLYIPPVGGGRWGRNGASRRPSWQWWGRSLVGMQVSDGDGDGWSDLCFVESSTTGAARVSVAYGTAEGVFDTLAVETVVLDSANGYSTVYTDLTGDSIPEIVTLAGEEDVAKIYIGKRGQRLLQQYGTGNDPPHPGAEDWWGRPWATVWMPKRITGTGLPLGYQTLLVVGDLGKDGVGDLAVDYLSTPLLYNGGSRLDSMVDGNLLLQNNWVMSLAQLGNVDGSGDAILAIGVRNHPVELTPFPGVVRFFRPDSCLSRTTPFSVRNLPEGTGPSDVPRFALPGPPLEFTATPSPARDNVTLRWSHRSGAVSIAALDMQGRTLQRWSLPASTGTLSLDLTRWPRGSYLFFLSTPAGRSATVQLLLQ